MRELMKISKIREMSSPELEKELGELKSELFKLKFSLATNGLDNPMKIKEVKKDIYTLTGTVKADKCNVDINSNLDYCPLCFNGIKGEEESAKLYSVSTEKPREIKKRQISKLNLKNHLTFLKTGDIIY
jgi:large subunit ribosomal protein L29